VTAIGEAPIADCRITFAASVVGRIGDGLVTEVFFALGRLPIPAIPGGQRQRVSSMYEHVDERHLGDDAGGTTRGLVGDRPISMPPALAPCATMRLAWCSSGTQRAGAGREMSSCGLLFGLPSRYQPQPLSVRRDMRDGID